MNFASFTKVDPHRSDTKEEEGMIARLWSGCRALLTVVAAMTLIAASAPAPLPMDVWYASVDDNGLPLNPTWEYSREGRGLPDAGLLCDHFPNRNGILFVQNCTTQSPIVDEPRPFHGLAPNLRHLACTYRLEPGEQLRPDSVHGHVNWGIVTYTGLMSFHSFGFPPFADGDWDWLLQSDHKAGYLTSNDPNGIIAEFNGAEVADGWTTPWWTDLRDTVMSSRHYMHDARVKAYELPAIVTGILGIDTRHTEHAEVHPIYALALRVKSDATSEKWALFARNWGDEGGCSNDQHNFTTPRLSFFFPSHGVDRPVIVEQDFQSTTIGPDWGAASTKDGLVVTFELPRPSQHALDFGELVLCYSKCPDYLVVHSGDAIQMRRDDSIAVVAHRALPDDAVHSLTRDVNH